MPRLTGVAQDQTGEQIGASRLPALIEWQAPEFSRNPEQAALLRIVAGLLAVGIIPTLLFKNFLFAIVLALASGLLWSQAGRTPRQVRVAVTGRGVEIGERRYEFGSLASFWISYDPPLFRDLVLVSKKAVMPVIRAPLGDQDPVKVREVLLRFLPEAEREESLMDIIAKRLGF